MPAPPRNNDTLNSIPSNQILFSRLEKIFADNISTPIYQEQIIPSFAQIRHNMDGNLSNNNGLQEAWFAAIKITNNSLLKQSIIEQFSILEAFDINLKNPNKKTALDVILVLNNAYASLSERDNAVQEMMTLVDFMRARGAKTAAELGSISQNLAATPAIQDLINNTENTGELDDSVVIAAQKLAEQYPNYLSSEEKIKDVKDEIIAQAKIIFANEQDKFTRIKGFLNNLLLNQKPYHNQRGKQLDMSNAQVLWIVWQVLNSPENLPKELPEKEKEKELRFRGLFKSMIEAQQEGICPHGQFNKLISVLEFLHPNVKLFSKANIHEYLYELAKKRFNEKILQLPPPVLLQVLLFYAADDLEKNTNHPLQVQLEEVKTGVITAIRLEADTTYSKDLKKAANDILAKIALEEGLIDAAIANIPAFTTLKQWRKLNQYLQSLCGTNSNIPNINRLIKAQAEFSLLLKEKNPSFATSMDEYFAFLTNRWQELPLLSESAKNLFLVFIHEKNPILQKNIGLCIASIPAFQKSLLILHSDKSWVQIFQEFVADAQDSPWKDFNHILTCIPSENHSAILKQFLQWEGFSCDVTRRRQMIVQLKSLVIQSEFKQTYNQDATQEEIDCFLNDDQLFYDSTSFKANFAKAGREIDIIKRLRVCVQAPNARWPTLDEIKTLQQETVASILSELSPKKQTLWHHAAIRNMHEYLRYFLLLHTNVEPLLANDCYARSPFTWALQYNHESIIRAILPYLFTLTTNPYDSFDDFTSLGNYCPWGVITNTFDDKFISESFNQLSAAETVFILPYIKPDDCIGIGKYLHRHIGKNSLAVMSCHLIAYASQSNLKDQNIFQTLWKIAIQHSFYTAITMLLNTLSSDKEKFDLVTKKMKYKNHYNERSAWSIASSHKNADVFISAIFNSFSKDSEMKFDLHEYKDPDDSYRFLGYQFAIQMSSLSNDCFFHKYMKAYEKSPLRKLNILQMIFTDFLLHNFFKFLNGDSRGDDNYPALRITSPLTKCLEYLDPTQIVMFTNTQIAEKDFPVELKTLLLKYVKNTILLRIIGECSVNPSYQIPTIVSDFLGTNRTTYVPITQSQLVLFQFQNSWYNAAQAKHKVIQIDNETYKKIGPTILAYKKTLGNPS